MRNSLIDSVENKTQLVPELRFPEFENEKGWKIQSIDELCEILNNIRKPISSSNRISGEYPYYGASGIIDYVDEYLFNEQLLLVGEDGAKWGAFENTAFLVKGKYWVNNHAHVLRPKRIDDKLLESYLIKLDLNPYITGAAPPKLTLGKLKGILVPTPVNPVEQQKIASCLSSLDELITANREKLEALQAHKKGLIQNLFPQEGQTVPNYRFPEFENDGEWVERSIGSLTTVSSGGTPTSTEPKYWGGDIPWMNSGELNLKKIYSVENKITVLGLKESSTKMIPPLCVLIGLAGQGKTRGTAAINYIELCTNQSIAAIHPNKKKFDSEFLYHKIDSMYEILRGLSTGEGGRGGLNLSIIRDIKIQIPSVKEQQQIASCLSEADNLINFQKEKIDQLQQHKKGLMQGLFPKFEV